jgi:hypothetical protein
MKIPILLLVVIAALPGTILAQGGGYAGTGLESSVQAIVGAQRAERIGSADFDLSVLRRLRELGSCGKVLEYLFNRSEAAELGIGVRYASRHVYITWDAQEGGAWLVVTVQAALADDFTIKDLKATIVSRKLPVCEVEAVEIRPARESSGVMTQPAANTVTKHAGPDVPTEPEKAHQQLKK